MVGQEISIHQNNENFNPILYFTDGKITDQSISENYTLLLERLQVKQQKTSSDLRFLRQMYSLVHKKQLGRYQKYASLEETLSDEKKYNCLTGTALYAMLLQDLGYDYSIIEFDYHVLLMVHLEARDVMIESTDPLNGFVISDNEMQEIIDAQLSKESNIPDNSVLNRIFAEQGINKIKLEELAGLQYYNSAIINYNNGSYFKALIELRKAYTLYPSKRIKGIYDLINGELAVASK